MDFFNKEKKKKALHRLEVAQTKYEMTGIRANDSVESLYEKRKAAVKIIEDAEVFLKGLPDIDVENIMQIAYSRASIRTFTEAIQNEENAKKSLQDSSGKYVGAAIAGTAVGAAVATLGPTAAMAFATTFGTAATGTAISTLSGVAATNAALAWIGGGALAAGGGGMAAGAAILSMAGPIGLAIGGVAAGAALSKASSKNKKIAEEADRMTGEIDSAINKLERAIDKIKSLIDEISTAVSSLQTLLKGMVIDGNVRYDFGTIVNSIKSLCKMINQKFSI